MKTVLFSTVFSVDELVLVVVAIGQIRFPQLLRLGYGAAVLNVAGQEGSYRGVVSLLQGDIGFQAHFHKVLDHAAFLCLGSAVALQGGSQSPLLLPDVLLLKLRLPLGVCFGLEVVVDGGLADVVEHHVAGGAEELPPVLVQLAAELGHAVLRGHVQSSLGAVPRRRRLHPEPFHRCLRPGRGWETKQVLTPHPAWHLLALKISLTALICDAGIEGLLIWKSKRDLENEVPCGAE